MKKRMYELAKTRRCLKKEKAHKRCVYGLSGVPGATRTPGLPLRRRTLYPAELRRDIQRIYYMPGRHFCQIDVGQGCR